MACCPPIRSILFCMYVRMWMRTRKTTTEGDVEYSHVLVIVLLLSKWLLWCLLTSASPCEMSNVFGGGARMRLASKATLTTGRVSAGNMRAQGECVPWCICWASWIVTVTYGGWDGWDMPRIYTHACLDSQDAYAESSTRQLHELILFFLSLRQMRNPTRALTSKEERENKGCGKTEGGGIYC